MYNVVVVVLPFSEEATIVAFPDDLIVVVIAKHSDDVDAMNAVKVAKI